MSGGVYGCAQSEQWTISLLRSAVEEKLEAGGTGPVEM